MGEGEAGFAFGEIPVVEFVDALLSEIRMFELISLESP
jgi:hypothetical protein